MENSVIFARKKFEMDRFTTSVKVSAPSAISKVLSVNARGTISSAECANGVVTASGRVFANVVYVSVDGIVERAGAEVEFIEKQQKNYNLSETFAIDDVVVESQNASSTEVMISVCHKVEVSGVYKYEITNFDAGENNLVLNKKSFNAMHLVRSADDTFTIVGEAELSSSNVTLLQADSKVVILDASCTLDKVVLEGKILADVFEFDGENYGKVSREFEFKQEVLAEGAVPNMLADAEAVIKNITVTPEEDEGKTRLSFAFEIGVKAYVYEETTYELAVDMFSLSSEITTKNTYIEAKNYHSSSNISDDITLAADVSNIENLDDVVGVYGVNASVVSAEDLGDKAVIKVKVTATALAKAGDDYKSIELEEETELEAVKDVSLIFDGSEVAAIIDSYKVKAGKELEVSAKVICTNKFDTSVSECFVSEFEAVKEKPAANGGIKVYITRSGETLFDVAKALSVKPEVITRQNEVSDIFEQGEKVYIYSPINLI